MAFENIELESNKRNAKNAQGGDYVFVVESQDVKGATIRNVDNDIVAIEGNAEDYVVKATSAGVIVTKNLEGLSGAELKAAKQFKLTITLQKENAKKGVDAGVVTLAFADGAIDLTRDGKNIVTGEGVVVTKKAKEAGALDIEIADETFGSVTAEEPTEPTEPQPGQSFTLTTGADKGAAFTGTDNADTFKADILTLTAGDELDGGAGADVLNVETNASVANTVKIANIETINMNALGAVSVDFANITGVQEFNSNNSVGAVSLNNVANAGLALGLKGSATNNINATFTAAAVAGTADVLNVNLNGATAAAVTVNSGFESVKVNTTAESTLATLTATGATSVTLNNSAKLTVNDGTLDAFQTYAVEGAGELNLGNVATVRTFDASKATGAVKMGADTTAGFAQGTATKALTMDTTGGLVQTGAGNDVVAVNAGSVFTTNSTSVKLGAGNDSLKLTDVGNGGLYVFGEAGDDTIYAVASLKAGNLIDGGEGTDTLNFAAGTNSSLIARSIEKVGLAGTTGQSNSVAFVSTDVATAIADGSVGATTVTGLLNGSTYSASVKKDDLTTLGFKAGEKATINANFTKGTTGGLTVTNAETVTATYGAASNLGTSAITLDAAAKSLTINATGKLETTGAIAAAVSGTGENLTTLVATGDKGIELGNITNDAKLTSVSVKATGGNAVVGTVGDTLNTAADFQVSAIEVTTTEGKANVGNIDFSGVATTATGLISSIVVSGVDGGAASSVGNIVADKLGTVSVTSTKNAASIGTVTVGADTIADTTDGTVTSLSAVGLKGATITSVTADKVDSITAQSTSTTEGNASVGAIDGNTTGKAAIGNVTVTSAGGTAGTSTIKGESLGNVTVTGKTTATLGAVTVTKTGNESVTGNIAVTAGTGVTLGAVAVEKAGSFNVKASGGDIALAAIGFVDTALKTVALDASAAITLAADATIKNAKGDLTLTVKAGGALAAANVLTIEAGDATNKADIDIIVDASQVTGNVGATTKAVVVDNKGADAASSTSIIGGKAANYITINTDANAAGTVTYQGQNGIDTITVTGKAAATINTEGGADVIVGGAGNDIINAGDGADSITGGAGVDTLTGGAGADTFSFAAGDSGATFGQADVITDFVVGTDKLQFTGVTDIVSAQQTAVQAAVTALAAGATAAQIAAAMATANTTDSGVSFAVFGGNTYVLYEKTGASAGVAADDVFIQLTGVTTAPTFAVDVVS